MCLEMVLLLQVCWSNVQFHLHILTPLKSHCGVCKNASILRAETPLLTDCDLQLIHNETELKYCGE